MSGIGCAIGLVVVLVAVVVVLALLLFTWPLHTFQDTTHVGHSIRRSASGFGWFVEVLWVAVLMALTVRVVRSRRYARQGTPITDTEVEMDKATPTNSAAEHSDRSEHTSERIEQLDRLAGLFDRGILDKGEFDRLKAEVLGPRDVTEA